MEFELGQTYSGYKFLDVVGRSRSAVQYRVQNTLAQRAINGHDSYGFSIHRAATLLSPRSQTP